MTESYRFARQIRLPEVGEAGQRAIASARIPLVETGLAGEIERRYLEAAGVTRFSEVSGPSSRARRELPSPIAAIDGPVGEVARGAFRALESLHAVLALGASG